MNSEETKILDYGLNTPRFKSIVHGPWSIIRNYLSLTKPTIIFTYALTGAAALVVEGSLLSHPLQFFLVVLAIAATGGSANAFNQYFERDIDAQMERTRLRRPLPQNKMSPRSALRFSIILGVVAVGFFAFYVNLLSAAFALGTILFYSFFYTLWLKPRTPYNIVIGGAAGATAPLIAWASATGHISLAAGLMFLIIFTWTPPHFWALALCVKDQYSKVRIPMLPVVKGEERTRNEILGYSFGLLPVSLLLWIVGISGSFYFWSCFVLGSIFIYYAWAHKIAKTQKTAYRLFGYSIFYIIFLFVAMMIDSKLIN